MALTTAQKNELAGRLVSAQQSGNYGSFNDLVKQLRLTQKDLLDNFPAINQAGINEQISRGAVVPTTRPPAVTYTTQQVARAIQDAIAAGFTVQQAKIGAMTNFGLSGAEFDKAVNELNLQFRGSAPTYQFPGLLTDRQQMPTGAQRFISGTPGSLLYDVPMVDNAEFVFQPGAFDYEAIRNQQAGVVDQIEGGNMPSKAVAPSSVNPVTTPAAPAPAPAAPKYQYTDAQVLQGLRESMGQGFSLLDSMAGAGRVYGIPQDQLYRVGDILALEQLNATKNTPATTGLTTGTTAGTTSGLLTMPAVVDTGLLSTTPDATFTPPVTPPVTPPLNTGITDTQFAQTAIDSLGQGTNLDQIQQAIQPVAPISASVGYPDNQVAQAVMEALGQGYNLGDIQMGAFNNFGVDENQFNRAVAMLPSMGYTIGQGFQ
jgi:hypothetical protein